MCVNNERLNLGWCGVGIYSSSSRYVFISFTLFHFLFASSNAGATTTRATWAVLDCIAVFFHIPYTRRAARLLAYVLYILVYECVVFCSEIERVGEKSVQFARSLQHDSK